MDYLGNRDLLSQPKTAFLASSTIPLEMVLRCYDWALKMSKEKICIISGFSSYLEERVLHFLIRGSCPIILVLARQMYKRVPSELQPLLDTGRLLIISTSKASRQSKATAFARNKYICELADKIIFVRADSGSSLISLKRQFSTKIIEI